MTGNRFDAPLPGAPTPVRFPRIEREVLANGLRIWSIAHDVAPVVTAAIIFTCGTADDPIDRPGLGGLAADLLDEGAGGRDAIAMTETMSRLGSQIDVGVGPDLLTVGFTSVAHAFPAALDVLADVVQRPHLALGDFHRVRELRLNRLKQLRQSPSALAERAFLAAVFGENGYGHGSLGSTASLDTVTLEEVRSWLSAAILPVRATLVVAGDVAMRDVVAATRRSLDAWVPGPIQAPLRDGRTLAPAESRQQVLLIDRPGAPQSEVRLGHLGPRRKTPSYHALVTMNSALGGQFSSRVNRHLREVKGWTYGARTILDLRREAGTFALETSVQADATTNAIADVLDEFRAVRDSRRLQAGELDRARQSLTRGYVRLFETAANFANAAAQLAAFDLPDDTFDRFVPAVTAVSEDDVRDAAVTFVRPDDCVAVVVGDAASCRERLGELGWPVRDVPVEL